MMKKYNWTKIITWSTIGIISSTLFLLTIKTILWYLNEIPEQFYYQFDGHHYYPVCYVTDFNNIPEKIINHEETI
jgi:hypothetical protein